jgi:DNA polymerase-3 subunit epsilon
MDPLPPDRLVDTLSLARRKYPGAHNSLDALCRRFGVDLSGRRLHGALLDANLLVEVYLCLTGERSRDLLAGFSGGVFPSETVESSEGPQEVRPDRRLRPVTPKEESAHADFVKNLPNAMWLQK